MIVAAQHAETHCERAGQRMEEGLFLDWIQLQCANVAMRYKKFAAPIEANSADAVKSIEDHAAMAAGVAAEPAILQRFVELTFSRVAFENIFESRRFGGHYIICFPNADR